MKDKKTYIFISGGSGGEYISGGGGGSPKKIPQVRNVGWVSSGVVAPEKTPTNFWCSEEFHVLLILSIFLFSMSILMFFKYSTPTLL